MGWLERTIYPHFEREPETATLQERFTPSSEEADFVGALAIEPGYLLSAMLLLKCFQALRHFPRVDDVPAAIVRHVRAAMRLDPRVDPGYRQLATPSRHRQAIRGFLGVRECDQAGRELAAGAMREAANTGAGLTGTIDVGVHTLLEDRRELPAFSTLVRMAREAHADRNHRVAALGLARHEMATLLSGSAPLDSARLREVASNALDRVDVKLRQLVHARDRLRELLERGADGLDRGALLDALCHDDEPAAPLPAPRRRGRPPRRA